MAGRKSSRLGGRGRLPLTGARPFAMVPPLCPNRKSEPEEARLMTQKFWWMALPALMLLGARSAGQTPPACPFGCAAKGAAAKADCAGCPNAQAGGQCGAGACVKEKVTALMQHFKALYKEGKYEEAARVADRASKLDPDNVAADAAKHIARLKA